MGNKQYSAGDLIEARCTRCRAVTNHTIIAMVGNTPARVRCNTCDGDHNYRPPKQAARPKETAASGRRPAKARTSRSARKDEEQWQECLQQIRSGQPVPYRMDQAFRQGEALNHPTFGLGLVMEVVPPNKINVLFEGGRKLLRCKL
jgi:hypothetical protein